MLKHLPLLLVFLVLLSKNIVAQCPTIGNTVTVTTTNPTGTGSLTNAINCVNGTANLTNIAFNIAGAGNKTIRPTASLPTLSKAGASIDGTTQGSTVIIDGSLLTAGGNGLTLSGNNISIQGLFIENFNTTSGNGISILTGTGCDISGNRFAGNRNGISTATPVQSFTISDNFFGLDLAGGTQANTSNAINIVGAPTGGVITGNTIANSGATGINILGGTVLISNNSIYCNATKGITRSGTAPAVPVITRATTQQIRGTAAAGRVIEIYVHSTSGCTSAPCQGKTIVGTATTLATGIWTLDLTAGQIAAGSQATATSTQNGNNTSEFSTCSTVANCSTLNANTTTTDVSCFGGNNGAATASATGGNPAGGYAFVWNTGGTTANISNLTAGNYTVTVSDVSGCTSTKTAVVGQPTALTLSISSQNITCFGGNDGAATANPGGGTPNYSYRWNTGQTLRTISNLGAGNYSVTAIDARGCMMSQTIAIGQPAALSLSISGQNLACFGDNTGSATANPGGGTPVYSYLWSNAQTAQSISSLSAGTYTVTLRDANGCSATQVVILSQPTALNLNLSMQNIDCFGGNNGAITANPSGGTPTYNYRWNNGQTAQSISSLPAGTYTVTLRDANGCSSTQSVILSQPSALNIALSAQNIACFGENTGAITANPSGGVPTYAYLWNNAQTTQSINSLPAGTYTVTLRDANGCTQTQVAAVGQPPALNLALSVQNIACFGGNTGTVAANPGGGTPLYTYLWNNAQTTQNIIGLLAGTYTVTLRDANGCTQTQAATVGQPNTALSLNLSSTAETALNANDGTATAAPAGGTPVYTYAWSNGGSTATLPNLAPGTYTVTVKDANNCTNSGSITINAFLCAGLSVSINTTAVSCQGLANGSASAIPLGSSGYTYRWNTGATTQNIGQLGPGTYTVTVADAAGCTTSINATVSEPPALTLILNSSNVTCRGLSDGRADAVPSGGAPVYTYRWNDGQTAQNISKLPAGTYTVTLRDANGCTQVQSTTIGQPATALSLDLSSTDETSLQANNGTATASPTGGTPAYRYGWSNGSTMTALVGLAPGTYTVTVSDANNCTISNSTTIHAFACAGLNVSVSMTNVTCSGLSDGMANAVPSGGAPPYTYRWSNGQTTQNLANLPSGMYTVTVGDASGCTVAQSINIAQPFALNLVVTKTDESVANQKDGTATATASGGTPALSFLWSNGATTAQLLNLSPGIYLVTVSDANGCSQTASATIFPGSGGGGGCTTLPVYAVLTPAQVCGNEPFILEIDDLYPNPLLRYLVYLPNGDSLIASKTSVTIRPRSTAFSGEYYVVRDSLGCRSKAVGGALVEVLSLAPGDISAGNDTVVCTEGLVVLKAQAPAANSGTWVSLGKATVDNPAARTTVARNLMPGDNRFVWKIALPGCPNAATDTVHYFLETPPIVSDDRYTLSRASDVAVLEVLLNDRLIGLPDTIVSQVSAPSVGNLEYLSKGKRFRFTVEEGFRGKVSFQYAVCAESISACGFGCDTATVTIDVLNLPKVPEGLVLDDAGENGKLTIKGVSSFERVELLIFNRWGDVVYHSKQYDNTMPWNGTFKGKNLPQGAYYYQLRAFDKDNHPLGDTQTGAIHLFDQH